MDSPPSPSWATDYRLTTEMLITTLNIVLFLCRLIYFWLQEQKQPG